MDGHIVLSGVTKAFGENVVVNNIDLNIREGEFFSMLGPSGCGKTTTLRMIAGFEVPTIGSVTLAGEDVTQQTSGLGRREWNELMTTFNRPTSA